MLSDIRLLYKIDCILDALKKCCSEVTLSNCWSHKDVKTVHVHAEYQGRILNAWGSDTNEALALGKALVELSERIHSKQLPKQWQNLATAASVPHETLQAKYSILAHFLSTSSGLAAHLSKRQAKLNALDELIERHVITKAMLEGISPERYAHDTFIWEGPFHKYIVVKRHLVEGYGYLYGTGASSKKHHAILKASNELSSIIAWSEHSSNVDYLLSNFIPDTPSEIQAFHLKNNPTIQIFSSQVRDTRPISLEFRKDSIWMGEIDPLPAFEKTGLIFHRTFSPLLQPFFFGKLANGPINEKAIDLSLIEIQADYNVVALINSKHSGSIYYDRNRIDLLVLYSYYRFWNLVSTSPVSPRNPKCYFPSSVKRHGFTYSREKAAGLLIASKNSSQRFTD